jgi:hypothetical protein
MVGLYFDLRICVLYKSPTSSLKTPETPQKIFFRAAFGRPPSTTNQNNPV